MRVLQGIGVSPGVALGEVSVLDTEGFCISRHHVEANASAHELQRLARAFDHVATEISGSRDTVSHQLGDQYAAIFDAHIQLLRDRQLREEIEAQISGNHCTAEYAVSRVLSRYAKLFQGMEDAYLRERAADIFDLEKRMLGNLLGIRREDISQLRRPVILLTHDLTPGETAQLDRRFVLGVGTEAGSGGSHTAIMAAALGIPCVVGVGHFIDDVADGEFVVIDGDRGQVILEPDAGTLARYENEVEARSRTRARLQTLGELPAETIDGVRVQLMTNIEFPNESAECLARGSDGVGLYRTEFLYLGAAREPTEDEQYEAYKEVIEAMGDKPVVIRTLDLGADKLAHVAGIQHPMDEKNPFLGLRSIRLSLRHREVFRRQIRAILRAGIAGSPRIMFPLVSTVGELLQAKRIVNDECEDLEERKIPFRRDIPIGIMVEVPATVMTIERYVPEVDFFSIGTNDLIQYALAVDRGNKDVASLYSASDPAVLKLIHLVIQAGRTGATPVSVCGQMSSNPIYTMLLLGMGLRQLSVPLSVHQEIKMVCRSVTLPQCEAVAARAMAMESAQSITVYLQEELRKVAPQLVV